MNTKIRKAAVIGSGVMGGGIAALLASAGIETLLLDIVPFNLDEAHKKDSSARNRIAKAGLDALTGAAPPLLMHKADAGRIRIGNLEDDLDRLTNCDWIIEVVVENIKVKKELFARIDSLRKAHTIVSSNTSGLLIERLSKGRSQGFCQHFLGTHFFNPVRYMRLLEIIPGAKTLPEVLEFVANFSETHLGKGVVWAKDTPGFIANRIGVHGMARVIRLMADSGLSILEVDALFGPAMGRPKTAMFKTADLVGLDTLQRVVRNTYDLVIDDEERQSFKLPSFVDQMVAKNLLGKKVKSGFYKTKLTPERKIERTVIDPDTLEYGPIKKTEFACLAAARAAKSLPQKMNALICGEDKGARFVWEAMASQFIYAANRIPEIADNVVEIDNAMKWGYNFVQGPFETWDSVGVEKSVDRMLAENLPVPDKVTRMLAAGIKAFYKVEAGQRYYFDFQTSGYLPVADKKKRVSLEMLKSAGNTVKSCPSASLIDLGDGVLCFEFHTKMNILNEEILSFMEMTLEYVDRNGVGLVIGNDGEGVPGAFSAGADLNFIRILVNEKRFSQIETMIEKLQYTIQRARYAPFPVVTAPYGMALGGGCEICLGSDRIVAHAELYMGLVEIGVGLLPAGGGCMNLWRRFIDTLPESIVEPDLAKFFNPVFMNIATAKVSTSAADARSAGFLGPNDRIVFNREHLIASAKNEVLQMSFAGYVPPLRKNLRVLGEAAQGMVNAEIANMRKANFISEYDARLARRIGYVISGGNVRTDEMVAEEVILTLEREAFIDLLKEEKSIARIDHMLQTGKPLRN